MKFEYILLICAGCVFVMLLFSYVVIRMKTNKRDKLNKQTILASYTDKNLPRMEYDLAFYDAQKSAPKLSEDSSQMTIDDLLSAENDQEEDNASPLFVRIDEDTDEITGNYHPDSRN